MLGAIFKKARQEIPQRQSGATTRWLKRTLDEVMEAVAARTESYVAF